MTRVMVFGKPGGGKSRLSRQLAKHLSISFEPLDRIEYLSSGKRVSAQVYQDKHANLIAQDNWVIDGLGPIESFWQRVEAADTLIYIDLPYIVHYWWVTKRLLKSILVKPEGWPDGASVWKGTLASWKFLRISPQFWNQRFYDKLTAICHSTTPAKNLYRITTVSQLNNALMELPIHREERSK